MDRTKFSWTGHGWIVTALLVFLLAVLAHVGSLSGEFVLDDRPFLIDNPKMADVARPPDFFSGGLWTFSNIPVGDDAIYRPLFVATLWANNQVWRGLPGGFHLYSLILHGATTLLLLVWLRRLLPGIDFRAAGLAAALFAVHPVHAEAIGWILAAMHLQATLLILAACLFHDRYVRTGHSVFLIVAAMLFGGAIFTAETGVVLPFFVLIHDRLRLGRWRFFAFLSYLSVLVIYLVIRKSLLGVSLPLTWDLATAGARLPGFTLEYLRYLLLPWPQPLYLAMPDTGFFHPESLPVAMILVVLWAIPLLRTRPLPSMPVLALVWLVVFLAPPLAAVFNPSPLLAMRYLYLPSVGLSILLAWWLDRLPGKGWHLPILSLLILLPVTFMAHGLWKDDGQVYARIVHWNSDHHAGYLGMAKYAERSGNQERAIRLYQEALAKARGKARLTVLEPLALLLGQTGNHASSLTLFRELTTLAPERSSAWVGVGNNLWFMKQPENAAEAYAEAVRMDPRNREACHNLRMALTATGRAREIPRVCFSGS